jgi:hypothetical protein
MVPMQFLHCSMEDGCILCFFGLFKSALRSLLLMGHTFTFLSEEFLTSFSFLDLGNSFDLGQLLLKLLSLLRILDLAFPALLILERMNLLHQSVNLLLLWLEDYSSFLQVGLLLLLLQNLGLGSEGKICLKALGDLEGVESSLLALDGLKLQLYSMSHAITTIG